MDHFGPAVASLTSPFVHLHLHTDHSLLDSTIRIADLCPRLLELGMGAVAITDRDTMSGVVDFCWQARRHGIKPILGCEFELALGDDHRDRSQRGGYRIVLLAKDRQGYRNLVKLSSTSHLAGFYYRPRIDRSLLSAHCDGLIGLSAGLAGEIAEALRSRGPDGAAAVALEYKEMFTPGDFYLELIAGGGSRQRSVNAHYVRMSTALGIPLVAANDCHYLRQVDALAHATLLRIRDGEASDAGESEGGLDRSRYVTSPAEMAAAFADVPQALANTVAIADACDAELERGTSCTARSPLSSPETPAAALRRLASDGLDALATESRASGHPFDHLAYATRLDRELVAFGECDAQDYVLIAYDFVRWAKAEGIPVGPGRGSLPGSLVAYCVGITEVDPLRYGLLFERFLNNRQPSSFPEIDVDVGIGGRDQIVEHLRARHGIAKVAHAAQFYEFPAQRLARERVAFAAELEGVKRHHGIDPSSIVISSADLPETVPCFSGPTGELVTQITVLDLERLGFRLFDLCTLGTLTQCTEVTAAVNAQRSERGERPLELAEIPMHDVQVFAMLTAGDIEGVFQLDSPSMPNLLAELRPRAFEELVAAIVLDWASSRNAGVTESYIRRKHGREQVSYAHPILRPLLEATWGLVLYQEQLMQIASTVAGYDLAIADQLRRTLGKKQPEAVATERARFGAAAAARGMNQAESGEVFEHLQRAAPICLSRAHAVSYALLTYRCAYLRHHYPAEFQSRLPQASHTGGDR